MRERLTRPVDIRPIDTHRVDTHRVDINPIDRVSVIVILVSCGLMLFLGGCAADDSTDTATDAVPTAELSPLALTGFEIAESQGCLSCHGVAGRDAVGPIWDGLHGSSILLDNGATVVADDTYLRRAITDPEAEIRDGFALKMPTNDLTPDQVDALVAYLEELA